MREAVLWSPVDNDPGDEHDEERRAPTSSMPPSFRVAVVASVAGLRDSRGHVPLDACVPTRTTNNVLSGALDWRASLVLLHIDGVHSLGEIATQTDISLPDAIAGCLDLVAHGVVEVNAEVLS